MRPAAGAARDGTRARALVLAAVLVISALGGCARHPLPRRQTDRYLAAWARGDTAAMVSMIDGAPADVAQTITRYRRDLRIDAMTVRPTRLQRRAGKVVADYVADLDLSGLGRWQYRGALSFVRRDRRWRVRWSPAVLHPALRAGEHLARTRGWSPRGAIVAIDGAPLASTGDIVAVGLEPDRIHDLNQVHDVVARVLGVPAATVDRALNARGVRPNHFVPIASLSPERLAPLRPQLEPVPGVLFRRSRGRVGPSTGGVDALARHVVGAVGEVTAERLHELGTPYQVGDIVGQSGIEQAFERPLAGTPSGDVHVVDATGHTGAVLHRFAGSAAQNVTTTLDGHVQTAAEHALAGVARPAALVAIDAATGEVRAVVSRPADQTFDRALAGRYPPGSTAKIVTTAALLGSGTTPTTPVQCAPDATVGGKHFKNFEGEAEGAIPFRRAFAISCNTAFVTQAAKLPARALVTAAATFGFDHAYRLPVASAGGRWPAPADDTEKVAEAIGQARVVASPLQMATVAAAIADGSWRPPRLTTDAPAGTAIALDPAVVTTLRDLMGEVVRTGTGTAAAVRGHDVAGKTGTAEFGTATPPSTHAWFVGYSGGIAFAVLVEGGGVGGRVAAPLAAKFVAGL
jgi:cell division protein FtsI/penicillin-binding protein 2